jgi:hypothetical protein
MQIMSYGLLITGQHDLCALEKHKKRAFERHAEPRAPIYGAAKLDFDMQRLKNRKAGFVWPMLRSWGCAN